MSRHSLTALVLLALFSTGAPADAPPDAAWRAVAALVPGVEPEQIRATPLEGLYEVTLGSRVIYVSADGRYIVRGDIVDIEGQRNLTEERRREVRHEILERIPEESMIVFAPKNVKHVVTVFTDVDCPYCARLHKHMADYNELGVSVRYVAFPRAGIPSPSYDKTVSVWCAKDPHEAIGRAKFGKPVAKAVCDNPVRAHYLTGQEIGVTGTPTIVLESGEVIPGYVPPDKLMRYLAGEPG